MVSWMWWWGVDLMLHTGRPRRCCTPRLLQVLCTKTRRALCACCRYIAADGTLALAPASASAYTYCAGSRVVVMGPT